MALAANALVPLADAKDHLNISPSSTEFDARVERYINAASQLIEDHTDRKLLYASYDIRRDGRRADRLVLPQYPVVAISALWDDPAWDFLPQSLIPTNQYGLEDECTVVLRDRRFGRANQNVRVQFTAGYQSPVSLGLGPVLPATLSYACLMTVEWLDSLRHDRRLGVASKGKNGENISFTDTELPPQVVKMLADFVRFEVPLSDAITGNG